MQESLAEIRARALRESAERRKQTDAAASPPPPRTPAATQQPVLEQPIQHVPQQQEAPQQQQQLTLQQAHDIGLQKGQQQSYMQGFVAACIICVGVFATYKGYCWMTASPAPARAAARHVASVAQ